MYGRACLFWVEADGGAHCVSEGAFPACCGPSPSVAFASHGAGWNQAGSGVTSSTSESAGLVLKSITIFRAGVGATGAKSLSISCGWGCPSVRQWDDHSSPSGNTVSTKAQGKGIQDKLCFLNPEICSHWIQHTFCLLNDVHSLWSFSSPFLH